MSRLRYYVPTDARVLHRWTRRMAIANWTCVSWVAHAPGTVAVNVTWIEREFNACQTRRSMYSSVFNRIRAIARYWSEIATFSYPLHHFGLQCVRPWDNRGKFTWIERGFNACQTPRSMFQSIFNRFPVIQAVRLKVCHFSTLFAHFCLPCVRPWDNRGKC